MENRHNFRQFILLRMCESLCLSERMSKLVWYQLPENEIEREAKNSLAYRWSQIYRQKLREDMSAVWPSHTLPGLLPWMTWELSFRKKLYKYLGMKADMHAYARAGGGKQEITDERLKN